MQVLGSSSGPTEGRREEQMQWLVTKMERTILVRVVKYMYVK